MRLANITRARLALSAILVVLALIIAACSQGLGTPPPATPAPTQAADTPTPSEETPTPSPTNTPEARRRLPYTKLQLIPRDAIRPIYDPTFISAGESALNPDELVIGVEFNGDSRAYSISILRRREIVNDTVGGVPILVTW